MTQSEIGPATDPRWPTACELFLRSRLRKHGAMNFAELEEIRGAAMAGTVRRKWSAFVTEARSRCRRA